MVVEIFIPCYYGSEILAVSEKLSESLFHAGWIEEEKIFKAAMTIFLEKVKRPIRVSIFGVFEINLATFTTICRSAYSLYAVFKSMGV